MSDQKIEQKIQDKGLTAPRVTPGEIEGNIVTEHYFTGFEAAHAGLQIGIADDATISGLHCLTFCILTLKNGFTVTGESACASPENFDAEIGRNIARQNAVAKIWPLMGYELKQRLHDAKE